ncbi:MAG TPA: hypothetical protein VID73_10420 [Ktedonobacterales bacterium]|jgi:hypothetical protein
MRDRLALRTGTEAAMSQEQTGQTQGVTVGDLRAALAELPWAHGLKRAQIRRKWRALPQAIYLRLPDSKRYTSADEVLRDARIAPSRAEGDFLGPYPDLDVLEELSLDDGGPPAWGPDPLFTPGTRVDSGSAEDRRAAAEPGDAATE